MNRLNSIIARTLIVFALWEPAFPVLANLPGGGTNGASVTLADNGTNVTIANGIISIVVTKSSGQIGTINYTFGNNGGSQTLNLVSGNSNGGKLYWENSTSEGLAFNYSLVADPASNGGNYAEVSLYTQSVTNDVLEVHYSLLRGSTGFYVTAIYYHQGTNGVFGMGECRDNIYAGSIFNWMSVDSHRNKIMEVSGGLSIPVQGAPVECYLWTNGIYQGQYEDKYKYSADLGVQRVWGWSSVGAGGKNVGLWNISASGEYYNGGPLKRELMEHIGTTVLNMLNGSHYGMGQDGNFANGEVWEKVYGPYFIYCNNITNTVTTANIAAQMLYTNALAQGDAEASAWPYYWFTNTYYAPASNRGIVTGQFVINDSGNPNASSANLWVGLIQQPSTTDGVYDFQQWMKPYQFWTRADTNGNFTVSNVIAGANYTLYAFGPGAADTFLSQPQTGGNPPIVVDYPATPFAVSVPGGAVTNLGVVTWTPTRVGATVFEIGYPDRMSDKFRHGDDYWVGDIGPSPSVPSPIWSKWLEFPFDFPNGLNYVVGQNRWTTDWNFIQPVTTDTQGHYDSSSSTITFNLPSAPANNAQAVFYLGLASDYNGAVKVSINGNDIAGIAGVTGIPNNAFTNTDYYAGYGDSDTSIREGNNGAFSDERINFPVSQLRAGANTINISFRETGLSPSQATDGYFADHLMYDYIRLELTGYVPPPPAAVMAYPGNSANLICWPVTPGATSYNLLRSNVNGSGYVPITNGITGPVCGSGTNNAAYLDTTAANGNTYYYEVQSVNSTGTSVSSPSSAGATPSSDIATTPPAPPAALTVTSSGHQSVTLSWAASSDANFYSVWRSILVNTGGGSSNTLSTIILNNNTTNTTYTDTSPTDGGIYQYFVTATGAGGTSSNSASVVAVPLPAPPASVPVSLTASFVLTNDIKLNWFPVAGAVGYVILRATSPNGPYTYLQTITELTYTDAGLNTNTIYYYRVEAMNGGGASAYVQDSVNSQQVFPASLSTIGTNAAIILAWPSTAGATSYTVKRGTSSGNETFSVITGYASTTFTNTGLVNGTTYYYVVTAAGPGGTSGNSPEASATPFATSSGIWISPANGVWSAATNWSGGDVATGTGSFADFSTLSLPTNLTVTLDTPRTISTLRFGDLTATYNWTLAGTNTLTLGTSPTVDVVNQSAAINTPIAGFAGLAKTGAGALSLSGATNTVTGGLAINNGTIALDYSAVNSPVTNIIPAANALMLGGSTLQIIGSSNTVNTQSFASTTLNAGSSIISAAPVSGTNNPTVTLNGITASAGGVVEFFGPATIGAGSATVVSNANITTTLSGNNAFIGGNGAPFFDAIFATVGLYDFAAATAASPATLVGGSQISGFYTPASGTAGTFGNLDVTGNITGWSAQPYLTGLRFNTSIGANISVAAYSTLTIDDFLVTPNVGLWNVSINNNVLRPAGGSSSYGGPFVVWQNNTAGELIFNSGLENSKAGTADYVQSGPGTVVINSTGNTYQGPSYLNGGVTLIAGNGSLGTSATGATINLNGGTLAANGTFAMDNSGASVRPFNLLGDGGGLAATAGNTLTVDGLIGSASGAGPLTIGIPASAANNNTAGLLPGTGPGTANTSRVFATGTVVLTNANYYTGGTVLQSGTLNINGINALGGANYDGVVFNGGTLQYAANLTGNNGSVDLTSIGTAGITPAAGGGTIDVNGNNVTYANSIGNNGNGALTLKSSLPGGVLSLQGANTYSGATTITNLTVLANNATGSATGSGDVLVQNGGLLSGTGNLAGSVTVQTGGELMPGGPFGALSIGNNLSLDPGSTTWIQIQHAPLANSAVNISGTFTAGGTLVVTNVGAFALANGDSFQLFNTPNLIGAFSSLILPTLATNLLWDTNTLLISGAISVVALTPPTIASIQFGGGNLTISGFGGPAAWSYIVLATTNLAASWTPVVTNQFDGSGNFTLTLPNAPSASQPQTFYKLQLQ